MKILDINNWNRKKHYEHFKTLKNPYFAVTIPVEVTKGYAFSKLNNISFFVKYLHDCMKAINDISNLKYRIIEDQIIEYKTINASATIMRHNNTFAFSFVNYNENLNVFEANFLAEKERINNTDDLYPPNNGLDCIHCSALPWFSFSGHMEPDSGSKDASVPKFAFSKTYNNNEKLMMNVAISVNHALVDGYHVGEFVTKFQNNLNEL